MILLAVSGGPDSMYLLNCYKKKKIIVAHVNYHLRPEANQEMQIVENFCKKYAIPCFVHHAHAIPKGNFQEQARKIRYHFFAELYQKYHCKKLLTAHHKDDFLETALMQQRSLRLPKYFGIAKHKKLLNMNIYRPLIKYWYKDEILALVKSKQIPYGLDQSNEKLTYTRNKIRHELKAKSKKEKDEIYQWFQLSNKILLKKHQRIAKTYQKWAKSNYAIKNFKALERDKIYLAYEYIHQNYRDIKISKNKLESFVAFIEGEKNQTTFKLDDRQGVSKKQGYLTKIDY